MASRNYYIEEGGAVRKVEAFPKRERVRRPEPARKKKRASKTYKKAAKEAQKSACWRQALFFMPVLILSIL